MHGWACLLFVPVRRPMVRSSALSLAANGKSKPYEQLYLNQMLNSCTITLHMPNFRFPPELISTSSYSLSQEYRYPGYLPQYQYLNPRPKVAGWSVPQASKNDPVLHASYKNPDIICHEAATPAAASVTIAAGSTIELQWSPWPLTHHGPVIDYLASCNGQCSSVDKTKLEFNMIDATGLLRNSNAAGQAGYWAADKLRDTNNSWTVTIPSTIARGGYVLRHEIIALHSARVLNGAQNYPHCINLEVTGTGTDALAQGTLGTELYQETDPGIQIDIYKPLEYTMPGPALHSRSDSAVTPLSGNSTSTYRSPIPIAAKTEASPAENRAVALSAGSDIAALNTSTLATNLLNTTSTPHIQFPHSDASPPKIAKAHQSADSLFGSATKPSDANSPPSLLDKSPSSTPFPDTGPSPTKPSSSIATPLPTLSTTTTPSPINSISKPCTRRIRITTARTSTTPSSPLPSSTIPPQNPNQAVPATSSTPPSTPGTTLPAEPQQPSLHGMSVQQLLRWLKAVVGALDGKLHGVGRGGGGFVREMGGL